MEIIYPRKDPPYFTSFSVFKKLKMLSKGAFGVVNLYFNTLNNEMFAIKTLSYDENNLLCSKVDKIRS